MNATNINRVKLLALATLFFFPFILAWVIFFGPEDWKPAGTTAVGHLVSPARPKPEGLSFQLADGEQELLTDHWTVLHIGGPRCDEVCEERLWQTRQMRTLLHRHRGRVQRAYLVQDPAEAPELAAKLKEQHPYLKILQLNSQQRSQFDQWMGTLPVADPVVLIDPLGNFLMYYGDELPMKGMLKDIKRVLKLSNIG